MTKIHTQLVDSDEDLGSPIDKTGLSPERKRLFEQVEKINRAWLNGMREMRRSEAEFSIRLFNCKDSSEAMTLCNQWMAKRIEILGAEQQLFGKCWADLVSLLSHPSAIPTRKKSPD